MRFTQVMASHFRFNPTPGISLRYGELTLAGPASACAHDNDRLRLPSVSPAQNSETGKKESTVHRLSQLCQPCGKPYSNLSPSHQSSVARIAKNGFATSSGVSKSAKVELASITVVIFCWRILLISESMDHHDSEIMDDRSID